MKLFGKNKKGDKVKKELEKTEGGEMARADLEEKMAPTGSVIFPASGGSDAYKVLKGFYVSEKASIASGLNQYVFRVFKQANKSAVKQEVGKLFQVKVKSVKILNMPRKRRDLGKHPGFKSGFKKAIVVVEEGYTIGQAKP